MHKYGYYCDALIFCCIQNHHFFCYELHYLETKNWDRQIRLWKTQTNKNKKWKWVLVVKCLIGVSIFFNQCQNVAFPTLYINILRNGFLKKKKDVESCQLDAGGCLGRWKQGCQMMLSCLLKTFHWWVRDESKQLHTCCHRTVTHKHKPCSRSITNLPCRSWSQEQKSQRGVGKGTMVSLMKCWH